MKKALNLTSGRKLQIQLAAHGDIVMEKKDLERKAVTFWMLHI